MPSTFENLILGKDCKIKSLKAVFYDLGVEIDGLKNLKITFLIKFCRMELKLSVINDEILCRMRELFIK